MKVLRGFCIAVIFTFIFVFVFAGSFNAIKTTSSAEHFKLVQSCYNLPANNI